MESENIKNYILKTKQNGKKIKHTEAVLKFSILQSNSGNSLWVDSSDKLCIQMFLCLSLAIPSPNLYKINKKSKKGCAPKPEFKHVSKCLDR